VQPLSSEILQWVERTIGKATVVDSEVLCAKATQPTWLLHLTVRDRPMRAVLKLSQLGWETGVRGEAATLQLLEKLDVTAPRLLGVDTDGQTGRLLLLETYLAGSNKPGSRSPLPRMRALGAAAARLHAVALPANHGLPHIDRPVWHDNFIAERHDGRAPTTPLIRAAEQVWSSTHPPPGDDVLVHGDLHHWNVLWNNDDTVVALIDWDSTGTGKPGIDLGWARLEAALGYSMSAADEIVHGWTDVVGRAPDNLAYWDLVASLQNHAEIGDRSAGRDDFLRSAMRRIDAG